MFTNSNVVCFFSFLRFRDFYCDSSSKDSSSIAIHLLYLLETFFSSFCVSLLLSSSSMSSNLLFSRSSCCLHAWEHFHISDDAWSAYHCITLKSNKIRVRNRIWIFIDKRLDSNFVSVRMLNAFSKTFTFSHRSMDMTETNERFPFGLQAEQLTTRFSIQNYCYKLYCNVINRQTLWL